MAMVGGFGTAAFNCPTPKKLGDGGGCMYVGNFGSCECKTESLDICRLACAGVAYGATACDLCSGLMYRYPDLVDFI
jgi:hypothetical protein